MNVMFPNALVECLGWTLVHFLWQGLLIAAVLAGGWRLLRNAPPNYRYLAGCFALLLLAVAPAITLSVLLRQVQLPAVAQQVKNPVSTSANIPMTSVASPIKIVFSDKTSVDKLSLTQRVERFLPLIVISWSVGVLILSLRLLTGWVRVKRLTRVYVAAVDQIWHRKLVELGQRLGMNCPVRLLQSALVEVPTVIGWLRPVILLPASCFVGLSPAQLESILAHELAHIRRHDYLVNLLQSVVETFLFYHPAVWWISRRVREERELCCDDLAVEICGDRVAYARALATLEELRITPAQLALAASGAPLVQRIRRLAGQSRGHAQRPAWPVMGIMISLLLLGVALLWRGNRAEAGDNANEPTNAPMRKALIQNTNTSPQPSTNSLARKNSVHSGPGRRGIISKLESIHLDSIEYNHLPFGNVINNLNTIAKTRDPDHIGINFFFDRQGPGAHGGIDPATGVPVSPLSTGQANLAAVTININPALHDLSLAEALDAIVVNASQPIHYAVLEFAVKFSLGPPPTPLETRTFHVDTNIFRMILESVNGRPLGDSSGNSASGTNTLSLEQLQPRQFLTAIGLDLDIKNPANVGKMFIWNNKKKVLLVRSTLEDLNMIEAAIQAFGGAPLQVDLKVKFVKINDSSSMVEEWMKSIRPETNHTNVFSTDFGWTSDFLTPEQFKKIMEVLERHKDANVLNFLGMTTESGRQAQFQSGNPSSLTNQDKFTLTPFPPVLDLIPYVAADESSIAMTLIPTIADLVASESKPYVGDFPDTGFFGQMPLPHYYLRQVTGTATVLDGQTLMMGIERTNLVNLANKLTTNTLIIFVTPTIINPDGTRVHKTDEKSSVTKNH